MLAMFSYPNVWLPVASCRCSSASCCAERMLRFDILDGHRLGLRLLCADEQTPAEAGRRRTCATHRFIAVIRITAPKQALDRMDEGFRRGGPELKRFPSFLGFELWRNEERRLGARAQASRRANRPRCGRSDETLRRERPGRRCR